MYLYLVNLPSNEENIAGLECYMLTGSKLDGSTALSDKLIDMSRTAYIEAQIEIYFIRDSLNELYSSINQMGYEKDKFKITCMDSNSHIHFKTKKEIEHAISDIFPGAPDLKDWAEEFVVSELNGRWLFGKMLNRTPNRWLIYNKKPHTFCNSLSSRMSRALVNIGVQNDISVRLLDPCCGMGTVLLQSLDMGIESYGADINETVAGSANENLKFFGFPPVVKHEDAAVIDGSYDISILDLPYGLLSVTDKNKYYDIINNMRRISSRSLIVSGEDITHVIKKEGFRIAEYCMVKKGTLIRHIALCE